MCSSDLFRRIITRAPNDPLVPAAFGSIANCHFQLATQEPKRYEDALENYRHVIEHPAADVSLRSQAGVAMGMVYERQAQSKTGPEQAPLLKLALGEYLNVLYGSNLKDGEVADAYWVKDAGSKALALLESQQRWTEAAQICSELIKQFPPLRPTLEKKLKMLRDKSGESGN